MAGLYIHIPFCKQACSYCDFHFSTSARLRTQVIAAICKELRMQKAYLQNKVLQSIYFGGGTPSLLNDKELTAIFDSIHQNYTIVHNPEITLEANPDDISPAKLELLKQQGINRLSIGIQSFNNEYLKFYNRAHNADEALQCIYAAKNAGFNNLTIDLIYGNPIMPHTDWQKELDTFFDLGIQHLAAYSLTVEPKTLLSHKIAKGQSPPINDAHAATQFEMLLESIDNSTLTQYEISNFSTPGYEAKHNSAYWLGKWYLGIGPSAHSFNGSSRQWNVANNAHYIKAIQAGNIPACSEVLSTNEQYNEYILTALRTKWGAKYNYICKHFNAQTAQYFKQTIKPYIEDGLVVVNNGIYSLSRAGKLQADAIAADLFKVN